MSRRLAVVGVERGDYERVSDSWLGDYMCGSFNHRYSWVYKMTHSPTNEPKTAGQWTRQLCDGLNLGKTSRKAIEKTLIAYAHQEGRELIEALEKVLGIADRKTVEFDAARKTVSIWKARNQ